MAVTKVMKVACKYCTDEEGNPTENLKPLDAYFCVCKNCGKKTYYFVFQGVREEDVS